jgi:replicative DNA helicase
MTDQERCSCGRALITRPGAMFPTCAECDNRPDACDCQRLSSTTRTAPPVPPVPTWEDPTPLTGQGAPLPEFPLAALPKWMRDAARGIARFHDTPADVAALAALGVVSVATARRARVNLSGQREEVNGYFLAALDSGQRKSGPFAVAATAPLLNAQQQLQADEDAMAQHDDRTPFRIRLFTTNATPAALRNLANDNGERIGILSSEGGVFDELAGRYNNVPDIDLALAGWNGEPYHADRATIDIPPMNRPVLTISLTVQPAVLKDMAVKPSFKDRGLLARFLYSLPADVVGKRRNERVPIPKDVHETYLANMTQLLVSLAPLTDGLEWSVSEAAYKLFHDYEAQLEPKLARGAVYGGDDGMREWASKLMGQTLKLAGLLHAASDPSTVISRSRIGEETMRAALRLAEYFLAHAEATFGLMRTDQRTENAREILAWVQRIDWSTKPWSDHRGGVTRREVCKYVRAVYGDLDGALNALRLLEKHGYLRVTEGLRDSIRCVLHPDLSAGVGTTQISSVSAVQQGYGCADSPVGGSSAGVGTTPDLPTPADDVPTEVSAHLHPISPAETPVDTDVPTPADSSRWGGWPAGSIGADANRRPTPAAMPKHRDGRS